MVTDVEVLGTSGKAESSVFALSVVAFHFGLQQTVTNLLIMLS